MSVSKAKYVFNHYILLWMFTIKKVHLEEKNKYYQYVILAIVNISNAYFLVVL